MLTAIERKWNAAFIKEKLFALEHIVNESCRVSGTEMCRVNATYLFLFGHSDGIWNYCYCLENGKEWRTEYVTVYNRNVIFT